MFYNGNQLIKSDHPSISLQIAASSPHLPCYECDEKFHVEKERGKHRLQKHRYNYVVGLCLLCGDLSQSKFEFRDHFEESHPEQFARLIANVAKKMRATTDQILNQIWIVAPGFKQNDEHYVMESIIAANDTAMERMGMTSGQSHVNERIKQEDSEIADPLLHPTGPIKSQPKEFNETACSDQIKKIVPSTPASTTPSSTSAITTSSSPDIHIVKCEIIEQNEQQTTLKRALQEYETPSSLKKHCNRAPSPPVTALSDELSDGSQDSASSNEMDGTSDETESLPWLDRDDPLYESDIDFCVRGIGPDKCPRCAIEMERNKNTRAKHYRMEHYNICKSEGSNIQQLLYCRLGTFKPGYRRCLHCEELFNWRPHYLKHLKEIHPTKFSSFKKEFYSILPDEINNQHNNEAKLIMKQLESMNPHVPVERTAVQEMLFDRLGPPTRHRRRCPHCNGSWEYFNTRQSLLKHLEEAHLALFTFFKSEFVLACKQDKEQDKNYAEVSVIKQHLKNCFN